MKKFLVLTLIFASVCLTTNAQTRRRTPTTRATQAKPAQKTQPTPRPQQPGASATASQAAGAATTDCACEGEPLPEVVAVVNGVRITKQEVDSRIEPQIAEMRRSVVEARARELDLQINTILLDAEAKKRGKPTTKLLEEEVLSKATEPTEAEAQKFYDQNKARINADYNTVKADLIAYLRDQRQREVAKQLADRLRTAAAVKVNVQSATPPANAAERARVFAVVNGQQITSANIEDSLKPLIYSVQERIYQLRKAEVDLRINDVLLQQEAQRRNVTTQALLDAEVAAKAKPVTDADAQKFYNENKERVNGEFAQLKPQIIQYLQDLQKRDAQAAFAQQLRQATKLEVNLRAPESPVLQIATDDQPAKGNPAAPVTIVEFTDFQCPSCAGAQPVLEKLVAEYGDRVRLVVRDFPLQMHEFAAKAAEAAEAARAQGKYWEYAGVLFANQKALGVDKLKEYATQVGLDRQKFDAALDSGQMADKVQRDLLDGIRLGVGGTPSFFINGRPASDRTYEGLKAAIEKALGEKAARK
ncbi:MAG TPA: thioredoxin domain-containing protein [Pyrinomonadaceae bacterium]|jgi:protein-disulfide isomerase